MKTLYEYLYQNIKFHSLNEYILESQGIFDSCEEISDFSVKEIISKITKGEHEFTISINKNDIKQKLFINAIKIEVHISNIYRELSATTIPDKYLKAIKISIYIPYSQKLESIDIKELLFHELTHWYTSDKMLKNSSDNFFIKNMSPKMNTSEDLSEELIKHIIYRFADHEQNAFNAMIKVEIDKIKSTDINIIFNKLCNSKYFNIVFYVHKIFNEDYYDGIFEKYHIKKFPELYKIFMLTDKNRQNLTDKQIFFRFKTKVNKAWDKFLKNIKRMTKKYANIENFKNTNFKNEIIELDKYITLYECINETKSWFPYVDKNIEIISDFYESNRVSETNK